MEPLVFSCRGLRRDAREAGVAILDLVCPPHCHSCGVSAEGLCSPCRAALEERHPPWCDRCGEPKFAEDARCRVDHARIRGLSLARAPLRYRGTGGRMVRRWKFSGDEGALGDLAKRMAPLLAPWADLRRRRVVVVSVPLFWRKRWRRGFDPAARLAEAVSDRMALRYLPGALARCRDTRPQGDPRVTSREANVRGAFRVKRDVAGRAVILVDDVVTSGHTARECGRVLRVAGATDIALLAAAQARAE